MKFSRTFTAIYTLLSLLLIYPTYAQKGDELVSLIPYHFVVPNNEGNGKFSNTHLLAMKLTIQPGWHIYFHNPGDSGLRTEFKFAPNSFTLASWPMPETFKEAGDLWTFGHHDESVFFFSPTLDIGKIKSINFETIYLICKDLCIPGKKSLGVDFANLKAETNAEILNYWEMTPLPSNDLPLGFKYEITAASPEAKDELWLKYEIPYSSKFLDFKNHNLVVPHNKPAYGWGHEELKFDEKNKLIRGLIKISWDGKYQDPVQPTPGVGKLSAATEFSINLNYYPRPIVLKLPLTSIAPFDEAQWKNFQKLPKITDEKIASQSTESTSLFLMIFFAFLGGLILNFMPCVLPVITLKFFQLVKSTSKPNKDFYLHNFWYSLGVIGSMLVLACTIISLKSVGHSIGWGFQMQSPGFVFVMLGVLFTMTLNLFGLFEWKLIGGNLTKINFQHDHLNHFWSGVLTAALSTPCSAPILGSALTFAFSQENFLILVIFFFIGLGLSFPFALISLFPSILKFFPKPGAWMELLKYFLGLSMLLSTFWLFDVLIELLREQDAFWQLTTLMGSIFFIIFIWKKKKDYPKTILIFSSLLLSYSINTSYQLMSPKENSNISSNWIRFNNEAEKELRTSQQLAFIDFTAKWCITCQVNKKLVMETHDFQEFAKSISMKTYRADWTNQDPWITEFLKSHGAVSVPAYFVIKGDQTIFIGETISINGLDQKIKENHL
ncbi:MAG: cytochrome c biogenesis protein CcdA [Bacteriovoracaceae bacterium]|nr:cytochrome c biogenesis protein CcdA [Bacteriovoracaceae bacterium]